MRRLETILETIDEMTGEELLTAQPKIQALMQERLRTLFPRHDLVVGFLGCTNKAPAIKLIRELCATHTSSALSLKEAHERSLKGGITIQGLPVDIALQAQKDLRALGCTATHFEPSHDSQTAPQLTLA